MTHLEGEFAIDETPEWTLDMKESDLLESYYAFNWEQVRETLAKLRRFRYVQPTDGREALLRKLLPVLDGFERVFTLAEGSGARNNEDLANWLKSFEGVYKRLVKILSQEGVQPIETVGQPIDLDCHEVVDVEQNDEASPGTVVKEEQKGYLLEDRVLRDAKVVVTRPRPAEGLPNQKDQQARKEES